jgi:hypothetical protein
MNFVVLYGNINVHQSNFIYVINGIEITDKMREAFLAKELLT